MTNAQERAQSGELFNRWQKHFFRELKEDKPAEWELLFKFLDEPAYEAHSITGIVSNLIGTVSSEDESEETQFLIRYHIVKPLHHALTMEGVPSKIVYGAVTLLDNTEAPPWASEDEAEEWDEMEFRDDAEPVEWNLMTDRTFVQSLIRNGYLTVMERKDVFLLRANAAMRKVEEGNCAKCRFLADWENGKHICLAQRQFVAPDSLCAHHCCDFALPSVTEPSNLYVRIDPDDVYLPPYTVYAFFGLGANIVPSERTDENWIRQLRDSLSYQED